jgi:hypothetical protein
MRRGDQKNRNPEISTIAATEAEGIAVLRMVYSHDCLFARQLEEQIADTQHPT